MIIKRKNIFPFVWYVLIIYGSLTPSKNLPNIQFFPNFDKVVHFGIYFVLTVLCIPFFLQKKNYLKAYILTICVSILSGIMFEFLQVFLAQGRTGSIEDAIANALGTIAGIFFYQFFLREKKSEKLIFKIE